MASDTFWSALSASATLLTGMAYVVRLADGWRYPRRTTAALLALVAAGAMGAQALCFLLLDLNDANLAAAVVDIAALLLGPLLARWDGGRLLFSMAAAYAFTFSTVFFSHMVSRSFGPVNLGARLTAAAVLFVFLHRWFAPCLHGVFRIEVGGWYGLSLIPLLFGFLFFVLIAGVFSLPALPAHGPLKPSGLFPGIPNSTVYCVLLVLPPCTYVVFYQFFRSLLRHYARFREHAVRSAQAAALKARRDSAARLRRRDDRLTLRLLDQLDEIGGLTRRGELDAALAQAEALEGRLSAALEAVAPGRWAADPILDAVLGEYAALAREADIDLDVRFALPEHADLDPAALAVVLSNALENAVRVCRAQPPGRPRAIRLTARNTAGQFFLQLENSCDAPVAFDPATGLPAASREGHGYGTRSIAAFVRQNRGVLRCAWSQGLFRLQILI